MSENSRSFVVGKTVDVRTTRIRSPGAMRLNSAAKALLQSNPTGYGGFLDTYGSHYVSSIVRGGSFFGSFTLSQRATADGSSLGSFAKFSADKVFFEASVSEDFLLTLSTSSQQLRTYANAQFSGGEVHFDPSSPLNMGQSFQEWENSVSSRPAELRFGFGSWYDLIEVQEVVDTFSARDRARFTQTTFTAQTAQLVTQEAAQASFLQNSVANALEWECVNHHDTLRQALSDMSHAIVTHNANIQSLTEERLLEIQSQVQAADYSWFLTESIQRDFESLVASNQDTCAEFCMTSTTPFPPRDQQPCVSDTSFQGPSSEYHCPSSEVVTGLAFTHNKNRKGASDAQTQVHCGGFPGGAPGLFTERVSTDDWNWHGACSGDVNSAACPVGFAAIGLDNTHICKDNNVPSRYTRLQCREISTGNGYKLSKQCIESAWTMQQAVYPDMNNFKCASGSVVTKVSFTHTCDENAIQDESWKVTCCPVQASFLWCPLSASSNTTAPNRLFV